MPKYTVKSPIKFKGKRYEIGKTVDMNEDLAAPLIEQGVLEDQSAKNKAADKDEK